MSLLTEFRQFAVKGNVIDLAVGVIIGAAFGKIVSSLVGDIVMPVLGLFVAGINFTELTLVLKHATETSPEVVIAYGKFLQASLDFLIIGFAVMFMVKAINRATHRHEQAAPPPAPPAPSDEVLLLTEIRDLLKRSDN